MNDKALIREIESTYSNIAGLAIQKNGELLYEHYYNGYQDSDTIHICSVTKSIFSILIGIAIDRGYIRSVDQAVLEFFPNYSIKRGEKTIQRITLKNILTMTASYKYKHEPYTKVYGSEDWTKAALDLLGGKGKIGDFKYSTVGAQILSGVLQNATGKSVTEFAAESLFTPLGISTPAPTVLAGKEQHIAFLKEKQVSGWVVDPQGLPTAGWGLTLRLRDMLKVGHLCLNQGKHNGKQIVSASWIKESTREHAHWKEYSYGYLWWNLDKNGNGAFAAIGDSGNTIYVSPEEQLVIALACSFKPRVRSIGDLLRQFT